MINVIDLLKNPLNRKFIQQIINLSLSINLQNSYNM